MTKSQFPSIPIGSPPTQMPLIGLGTWKSPKGVTSTIAEQAIRKGYRHLDCACDYGNEKEVGAGIAAAISAGVCTREELFVTSKLWNTFHKKEHVRPALIKSLNDLGLDRLELYLIHFPISLAYVSMENRYPPEWLKDPNTPGEDTLVEERVPLSETWAALEACVDEGLVSHIGVSNFPVALLMDLLSYARIKPAVLQVELHPYLQQPRLLEFCKREGIAVTAFSPLGAGSYRELGMDKGDRVLDEELFGRIGKRVGKSCAQVVLRWGLQRGCAVIPKTSKVERLEENMNLFDFELSESDMKEIAKLDKGRRYNDPGDFCVGMGRSVPIYD